MGLEKSDLFLRTQKNGFLWFVKIQICFVVIKRNQIYMFKNSDLFLYVQKHEKDLSRREFIHEINSYYMY